MQRVGHQRRAARALKGREGLRGGCRDGLSSVWSEGARPQRLTHASAVARFVMHLHHHLGSFPSCANARFAPDARARRQQSLQVEASERVQRMVVEYLNENQGSAPESELVELLLNQLSEGVRAAEAQLASDTSRNDVLHSENGNRSLFSNSNGLSAAQRDCADEQKRPASALESAVPSDTSLRSRVVARYSLADGHEMVALLEETRWSEYVCVTFVTNMPQECAVRYAVSDAPHSDTWLLEMRSPDKRLLNSDVLASTPMQCGSVQCRRAHVGLRASIVTARDGNYAGAFSLPLQNALAMSSHSLIEGYGMIPACEDTIASSLLDQAIAQREGSALYQKVFHLGNSKRLFARVLMSREVRLPFR